MKGRRNIDAMILRLLKLILEIIRVIVSRGAPPKPGQLRFVHTGEDTMGQRYNATLAAKTANDVVSHEVTLTNATFEDDGSTVKTVPDGTAEIGMFRADDGANVSTSYVQIDDAGNRSEPVVQSFASVDDIAPAAPGELGIQHVGEE